MRLECVGLSGEHAAACGERFIELVESVEMLIGDGFVCQRPEMFGRLQFGTVGRQENEADPLRYRQVRADVPPGAIEHEQDELFGSGAHRSRKAGEDLGEKVGVDGRAGEPLDGAARGVHEAIEVQPLVARMADSERALSTLRPNPPQDWLQTRPVLVFGPQLDDPAGRLGAFFFNRLVQRF